MHDVERGKARTLRMKWRLSYSVDLETRIDQGEIDGFDMA